MTQPPPPSGPLAPQPGGGWNQSAPQPGGWNQPAPAKKPSKAPTILIILGVVILGLSVVIGIVVAVIGFGGVAGGAAKYQVYEGGSGTYTAEADETVQLYVDEGVPAPQCTVDGPSVGEGTSQTSTYGDGERSWESFDSFTAEEAGDYTIDCAGTAVMVGPPISIGGIFAGLGGIFLAIAGGALGLLLLVIGVILLLVRRSRT